MIKSKIVRLFAVFIFLMLLTQCQTSSTQIDDNEVVKERVNEWNLAHNEKDLAGFAGLFNDSVNFYQTISSKNECIKQKLNLLEKNKDFSQRIIGDIKVVNAASGKIEKKCSFLKRVTMDGKVKDYPSYLNFTLKEGNWYIVTEGDLITDENLANKAIREGTQKGIGSRMPLDAVKGDYNGDGEEEYMWLEKPKFPEATEIEGEYFGECLGECECYIRFSNKNIASIRINTCIGGEPVNEGDLDDNGTDEIGLLPYWWTSCWRSYLIYSLNNDKWKDFVEPISTHCVQWEKEIDAIEKSKKHNGYVIVRSTEMGTFEIKEELVKVK